MLDIVVVHRHYSCIGYCLFLFLGSLLAPSDTVNASPLVRGFLGKLQLDSSQVLYWKCLASSVTGCYFQLPRGEWIKDNGKKNILFWESDSLSPAKVEGRVPLSHTRFFVK